RRPCRRSAEVLLGQADAHFGGREVRPRDQKDRRSVSGGEWFESRRRGGCPDLGSFASRRFPSQELEKRQRGNRGRAEQSQLPGEAEGDGGPKWCVAVRQGLQVQAEAATDDAGVCRA